MRESNDVSRMRMFLQGKAQKLSKARFESRFLGQNGPEPGPSKTLAGHAGGHFSGCPPGIGTPDVLVLGAPCWPAQATRVDGVDRRMR